MNKCSKFEMRTHGGAIGVVSNLQIHLGRVLLEFNQKAMVLPVHIPSPQEIRRFNYFRCTK